MPVGTSFENSSMKASFSLSSLQAVETTPENKGIKHRPYNSLTKKRVKTLSVRRSWGSIDNEQRDDFWSALQANYNYIMDNHLIDKCQEANSDLNNDRKGVWSLNELFSQYSELYLWLDSVQEMIYGKEENVTDKAIRLQCQSMVLEKNPSIILFNEQASQMVELNPELQEEVSWRVSHLNSKWDAISNVLGTSECGHCDQDSCLDIDHEVKCLKKWIKNMELVLQPLDLKTKYTKTEIETKALELKVLHRDIENHGKIVGLVVKLCKRSDANCSRANIRRFVNGLERRWHLLFLSSLEWQCYLECLSKREHTKTQRYSSDSDSECCKEPVNKCPRLSGYSGNEENGDGFSEQKISSELKQPGFVMNSFTEPTETNSFDTLDGNFVPNVEDTSNFTRSNRKGPNLATYYFKHEDTDSDMDKVEKAINMESEGQTTEDDMSEEEEEDENEEWTYQKIEEQVTQCYEKSGTESTPLKAKPVPDETIKRLVQKAEELVSPDKSKSEIIHSFNKMSRVKQWLSINKPEDSCDASGEDEERETQMCEDLDVSSSTYKPNQGYHSENTSLAEFNRSDNTIQVQMRAKKYTGSRPWSVSCIPHFEPSNGIEANFQLHSNSESALQNINLSSNKIDNFNASSAHTVMNGNNSTSSTMEDSCMVLTEEKTSPTRRRRFKMRRKFSNKSPKMGHHGTVSRLFKSASYSGQPHNNMVQNDRHTASDPPSIHRYSFGKYDTTSGADTDDSLCRKKPSFKIGSKTHYLMKDLRDTSPGKNSLNATEEQSSSLSEQAWDSYQEKYMSEAYSETHDSDAARKLLEFGEDYRNFIDSQSDWSTNPDFSPPFRRRTLVTYNQVDSDSDTESIKYLINSSRDQLHYAQGIYQQHVALGLGQYLETNDISEMVSTCDRHIDLLNHIDLSTGEFICKQDKTAATALLEQWTIFKQGVLKMQDYRNLQKDILLLKHFLTSIKVPDSESIIDLGYVDDLGREVNEYEKLLKNVVDQKKTLLELNVAVHHFVVENKEYNASSLKSDIATLYCLWEELHKKTSNRLSQLQPLLETWKTLDTRIDQLHGDLRSDEKTLRLLDTALKGGTLSEQTAVYVRDVAKLLSETNGSQGCTIPELFQEGSWSDSGISDEGSEHELGERERRLAAIRRLVRQLEVVLSPDSDARVKMAQKITSAEEELRLLQKRCRSLIVRSAACSTPVIAGKPERQKDTVTGKAKDDGGEPDDLPTSSLSWFRRAVRASVPFQLVLVTILCIAWLLEPQCCDNMNNYAWSFSPQLRYINGPPPI